MRAAYITLLSFSGTLERLLCKRFLRRWVRIITLHTAKLGGNLFVSICKQWRIWVRKRSGKNNKPHQSILRGGRLRIEVVVFKMKGSTPLCQVCYLVIYCFGAG
ncbi:MAG: hypothetical protein II708_05030 [Paludibacteraceae bacterium]|nr:hypothetical protein [Paludibacteraceae bacterium]